MSEQRQDLLGILEGYYLTSILDALYRSGALAAIRKGQSSAAVAQDLGFDHALLAALLGYLEQRTTGLLPAPGNTEIADLPFLDHLLDQYVGAFGPCLGILDQILRDPKAGVRQVDWTRHMRSFAGADRGVANSIPLKLLAELDIDCVVDLGCGAGGFLLDYAAARPSARAWGIDSNTVAIQVAANAARLAGIDARVHFIAGDARCAVHHLDPQILPHVQAVTAFNLANAFFDARSGCTIGSWLGMLSAMFPNRLLLLRDYYPRIGATPPNGGPYRRTMIHDVAQLLTMQGLPPADIDGWRAILDAAGCTLVQAFEGEHEEVAHFLYLVQL